MHTQVCQVNGGKKLVQAGRTAWTMVWESFVARRNWGRSSRLSSGRRGILSVLFVPRVWNTVWPPEYLRYIHLANLSVYQIHLGARLAPKMEVTRELKGKTKTSEEGKNVSLKG